MDGLDSLLFVNFGDLSIYQKSISFVEFNCYSYQDKCLSLFIATTQTEPPRQNFETSFEISQSQVKI